MPMRAPGPDRSGRSRAAANTRSELAAPATLQLAPQELAVGSAQIELVGGRVELGQLRFTRGELNSSGALTGLSLAKLLEWGKVSAPVQTSILIGGRWNIVTRSHVDGHIELHRESGDASIAVDDQRIALQISELALAVDIRADALSAELRAEGKGLGRLNARRANAALATRQTMGHFVARTVVTLRTSRDHHDQADHGAVQQIGASRTDA